MLGYRCDLRQDFDDIGSVIEEEIRGDGDVMNHRDRVYGKVDILLIELFFMGNKVIIPSKKSVREIKGTSKKFKKYTFIRSDFKNLRQEQIMDALLFTADTGCEKLVVYEEPVFPFSLRHPSIICSDIRKWISLYMQIYPGKKVPGICINFLDNINEPLLKNIFSEIEREYKPYISFYISTSSINIYDNYLSDKEGLDKLLEELHKYVGLFYVEFIDIAEKDILKKGSKFTQERILELLEKSKEYNLPLVFKDKKEIEVISYLKES